MLVGGFPSSPDLEIEVRPLYTSCLEAIYNSAHYASADMLCEALQPYVDYSLLDMCEPDFIYLLAFIDKQSFPESTRDFDWRCITEIEKDGKTKVCNTRNTETVRHHRIIFKPMPKLPTGLRYPIMRTFDRAAELESDMAQACRWIDTDLDYDSTLSAISYSDLLLAAQNMHVTAEQEIGLKCSICLTPHMVRKPLNPLTFLRTFSPKSVMNMQLNLTVSLHSYIPDDIPVQKLLYWHSCWEKDKNEAEKEKRMREAKHGRK